MNVLDKLGKMVGLEAYPLKALINDQFERIFGLGMAMYPVQLSIDFLTNVTVSYSLRQNRLKRCFAIVELQSKLFLNILRSV